MTDSRPLIPVNTDGLDDLATSLLEGTSTSRTPKPNFPPSNNVRNPENYIILPEKNHGAYSYPNLLVAAERSQLGKNWYDAQATLHQEDSFMLTIRQFADFLALLRTGEVYDGRGSRVDSKKINALLDEITAQRNPYRAEWLDAKFSESGNVLTLNKVFNITYHDINTGIAQETTEPLEDCLREDKKPGIDLGSWLGNSTYQGLPTSKVRDGPLWYWHPKKNQVAGFWANSGRVSLVCDGDPQISGPSAVAALLGSGYAPRKLRGKNDINFRN